MPPRRTASVVSGRRAPATNGGTLRPTANGYFAQFSIGGGKRKGVLLRGMTREEAERHKLAIAKLVERLREAGHTAVIPHTIADAGIPDDTALHELPKL